MVVDSVLDDRSDGLMKVEWRVVDGKEYHNAQESYIDPII